REVDAPRGATTRATFGFLFFAPCRHQLDFSPTTRTVSSVRAVGSPLLVWVEDVVFVLHRRMARESALGAAAIGCERVGRGVIVEWSVAPSATVRKSPAVLLHEVGGFQRVGH